MLVSLFRAARELMALPPVSMKDRRRRRSGERVAATDTTGDDAILAKFAEWCELENAYEAAIIADDGAHPDLSNQADEIETAIWRLPAASAVGLAIKTFLLIYLDCRLCPAGSAPGTDMIVRDLIRFAPVLEPRCRDYLSRANETA